MYRKPPTNAELARQLGVSRSHVTLLCQGKRKLSKRLADKLADIIADNPSALSVASNPSGGITCLRWVRLPYAPASEFLTLITDFLKSRRQGLSPRSLQYYRCYLGHSQSVVGTDVSGQKLNEFLNNLKCQDGGRHAYYRSLRAFYRWLYSPKSGYGLNPQNNPILAIDPPKVAKKILPSLSQEQVDYLIEQAGCVRDKAIISLFADSGLRLSELTNINPQNINWGNRTIKVVCKGNKEGFAPFGQRTEKLLQEWMAQYQVNGRLWDLRKNGIEEMLKQLKAKTGLPCNAHTFRRTFACNLAKKGIDSLHIMRLGRWESIAMVERYTRSVKFEDSLKLYRELKEAKVQA